jgi:hypothetical protein
MEWLTKLAASAGSAAGIVLGLAAVIGWLLKERTRLMAELASERDRREELHDQLHRVRATYAQTLLGVAHRLQERTRSLRP